jgi:hypothetical protein
MELATYSAPTATICEAVRSQFKLRRPVDVAIRSHRMPRIHAMSPSACDHAGQCQGEFRDYVLELLTFQNCPTLMVNKGSREGESKW